MLFSATPVPSKGREDQECFTTVFFQGFNYSFKCRYIETRHLRFASCVVLILVWIFIYEALGIPIIGIYVAVL
jgi:hypothetical protein